jgi:hypothetical protein
MYFDADVIFALSRLRPNNPGIAVAWFALEPELEVDIGPIEGLWERFDLKNIDQFVVAALVNFESLPRAFTPEPGQIVASTSLDSFARYVLEQPVVIERSPPDALPFSGLLKKASGAFIGTYVGIKIGENTPLLLLLTVPGGIMIVSSAIGVSKALEKGFNKIVSRAFKVKKS